MRWELKSMRAPNRNILWAKLFVDELARSGLKAAVLAPGSRNTPLVVAFAEHRDIQVYSHIDERSAAYFALGLALAAQQPVALVCSSGTAGANFYPAIIEAHYWRVPLMVLTADRPPELRESGANQTIDQVKLYGDHVRWFVDVALPEAHPEPVMIRSIRTLAARAYATADGTPKGAVHVNFPFRKPLEPILVETDTIEIDDDRPDGVPFTRIQMGAMSPNPEHMRTINDRIGSAKRGVIYAGSGAAADEVTARAIIDLADKTGFLLFADALSNTRFVELSQAIIGGYETFLRANPSLPPPDVVIQVGGTPTSQALDDWLNHDDVKFRALITRDGVWTDPAHRLDILLQSDIATFCDSVLDQEVPFVDMVWRQHINTLDMLAWKRVEQAKQGDYFDGMVVADAIDLMPDNANLFIANSLPVRHLDQFARPNGKKLRVFCNRGASGIDGIISTALGVAAGQRDRPLVLVTGDLAFYHDMNGLLAFKRLGIKATIVIINNDGGGIFYRLPIKDFEPTFTDLFITPTGLDFSHAAALYGVKFARTLTRDDFRAAFSDAITSGEACIIEVPTDFRRDDQRRREIIAGANDYWTKG
jgi:2-succinyl-5-enolpyruvyl-6-hydroxy-3-cyclohexene-1-carboxylate synthase